MMAKVHNLFDSYAVRCDCGKVEFMLLRSGKVICKQCKTEWTNLKWSCSDCPGGDNCCRNNHSVGVQKDG